MRRDVGLAVGDAQYDLPVLILQPGRGHLLAVQRRRDQRRHRQRLVRGALIGDVLPVGLPGQRLSVQREGFISAHVFNAGQQGAVGQHIQLLRVFQADAVGQAPHRAVRADNGVNPLVPGALREGCHTAHRHDQRNQNSNDTFTHYNLPFFSVQRAAFMSKVV